MKIARITIKGQVTIPKEVRLHLGIQAGDSIIFTMEEDRAVLRPHKKKSILDFYGVMPATREFTDSQSVREEIYKKISKDIIGEVKH